MRPPAGRTERSGQGGDARQLQAGGAGRHGAAEKELADWLEQECPAAANSLREGLEECFTINRLGIPPSLHHCLATNNLIESPQSGVRMRTRRVCRCRGWRQDEGADLFGEAQTVINTANKLTTAIELWQGVAYAAQARAGVQVRWARGDEAIGTPNGSRWLVQAATPNLGVGYSVSLALCDEAWNVPRDCVESSLVPTMLKRVTATVDRVYPGR